MPLVKQAIPDLPKENAIATADKGRVSQGAAQAFLSRVALYEGTWQKFRTGDVTRINDLLDIARIESGQYKLNLSVFDINDLIGRVLITFEARITAKHADVDAQLDYEPVFVEADRDRIGQVLHNLIDNAIKFMPENYGLLTIKSVVSKHKVYVSICDNGPGIPKEDIAHIFDRFYKAEKAHTYKNGSGTGLGLSIVKLVIDQHHGEIKAESSENGTVFTFSLKQALPPPRRQPAAE